MRLLVFTLLALGIAAKASVPAMAGPSTDAPIWLAAGDEIIYDQSLIKEAQGWLYSIGAKISKTDGVLGPETATALRNFQSWQGLPATGTLTSTTLEALRRVEPPTTWGAIAYSASGGYSAVWNYSSRSDAENKVIASLRRRTFARIRWLSTFGSTCIALARHYRGVATHGGNSLDAAEDAALAYCRQNWGRRCLIIYSFCADGRHK